MNADGSATITVDVSMVSGVENVEVSFDKAVIFGYADDAGQEYQEEQVTSAVLSEDKKTIVVTLSKELVDKYKACGTPIGNDQNGEVTAIGIDFYFNTVVFGISASDLTSLYVGLN